MACTSRLRQQILYFTQIFTVLYTCTLFVVTFRFLLKDNRPSPCSFIPSNVKLVWAMWARVVYSGQFIFVAFALVGFMRHRILENCTYEWSGAAELYRRQCLPHIRLIIVTTGTYSKLVMESVNHHFNELIEFGWPCFEIVVLTEKSLPALEKFGIYANARYAGASVNEVVVPACYQTPKGTLYKARNLEYARNFLIPVKSDSWVVHLDEDTRIHASAVHGMASYMDNVHSPPIGQGAFAYGWDGLSLSLPSNAIRTGLDLCHHYAIACLTRRPPSLIKGGMFVVRSDVSRHLSFDLGPHCSVTEDIAMSRKLAGAGIEWGWVHGVVTEQSPTFSGYIRQRSMWIRGICFTLSHCRAGLIPFIELFCAVFFWQTTSVLGLVSPLWIGCQPLDDHVPLVDDLLAIVVACYSCSMLFGMMFSFRLRFHVQLFWMIAHIIFPVGALVLTMYTCWIDLVGLVLGSTSYIRDLLRKKAPGRPLTDKTEQMD